MSLLVPVLMRFPAPLMMPLKVKVAVPAPWKVVLSSIVIGALTFQMKPVPLVALRLTTGSSSDSRRRIKAWPPSVIVVLPLVGPVPPRVSTFSA